MTSEDSSRSELAQLVAHHILSHVDWDELVAIVDGNRLTDEIRRNHGCS